MGYFCIVIFIAKINLEQYLSDIEVISGYLKVSKSPQIETLYFFRSLKSIKGNTLYQNKYIIMCFV